MKIELLSLAHKDLLEPKFRALGLCLSEYSFASRFLFRRSHEYHVIFEDHRVWLRGKTRDGVCYLMPTEDLRNIPVAELLEKLKRGECFYPIPESWISSLSSDHFQMSFNRDDSDYIFKKEKIAEYPGRDLSAKRNLVKQFLEAHEAKIVPYKTALAEDAMSILNAWQKGFKGEDSDFLPCQDGIRLADELGLFGYLIYIDEKPAAMILGEHFTKVFVIHFAKALIEYKGIYQFLFKELASQLSEHEICCLNWEQDMGQEGLRKSKLSYQPDKLASKYRVFARMDRL